jgi:hypothetical protein
MEKIEAQNEFRTIMVNLLPFMLASIPEHHKTEVIKEMSEQVEKVVAKKYISGTLSSISEAAGISCSIMNRLGGDFFLEKAKEKVCTVKNKICPWGEHGRLNPLLCMLTKSIFTRVGIRVNRSILVDIKRTIAGGDKYCLIDIYLGEY